MGRLPNSIPLQALIDSGLAQTPPGRCVWVALSGGLDSVLLLTLAADACRRYPRPLHALHVHHGLQADADGFEVHCRRLCSRLGVPLFVERVSVDTTRGQGLEGAAREARYAAFARRVGASDCLWLAQHRDDQAETFLLAALRGSGVRGLAGMPAVRAWQGRRLVRPLLGVARAELEAEAARRGLDWAEDASNADERIDRNYLRHRILPGLTARWPHAAASLSRSAALAGEAEGLLGELAELDLERLGGDPARLPTTGLSALRPARQRLLLRHVCARSGLPSPPAARLATLLDQLASRRDADVRVAWEGVEARVWRGELYLLAPLPCLPDGWETSWSGKTPLVTPQGSYAVGLRHRTEATGPLLVRQRQGGETLRLPGRGSRDLKRLLQEMEVPPWERQRLLVAWWDKTPVAALDPLSERWLVMASGWRGESP
ncbi:MAG: tRNA lysidine(34) synthetase TilS [Pseudomonadota bacterium]